MRSSFYLLFLICWLPTGGARAQTWLSAVGAATGTVNTNTEFAEMRQSATDAAGNVYFTGRYRGTVQFGTTTLRDGDNAFVAKLSPTGVWLWAVSTRATSAPGIGNCHSSALALAPNGDVVIAGGFDRDTNFGATTLAGPSPFFNFTANSFVACLSAAGAWRWATSARTPGSRGSRASVGGIATGVAVASTGEVLVTGNFRDTLTFGATTLLT